MEVIPTYRVQLADGGWMVVEERQIKPAAEQSSGEGNPHTTSGGANNHE